MNNPPPAVRVLPMSEIEFEGETIGSVQSRFFLKELPHAQRGDYDNRSAGLESERGTLVLFQFANSVIGSAIFLGSERYDEPKGPYKGVLRFWPPSIRAFDPIGPEKMKEIWPHFVRFSNAKLELDAGEVSSFEANLTAIASPRMHFSMLTQCFEDSVERVSKMVPPDIQSDFAMYPEIPKRRSVAVEVFDRNPHVVDRVRKRANGICERCKKAAPFVGKSNGIPYLEVHHKIRLADGGFDTVENAIALCPNCHREIHYG